jgi:hypothetical protein
MVNEEIKSGYNKVVVWGNAEQMTIEMVRSSTSQYRTVINRHPGILERLWPACYDPGLFILRPTEEVFRQRIKKSIKIALDVARSYDEADAKQERELAEEKRQEAQKKMELDQFIATLKEQVT